MKKKTKQTLTFCVIEIYEKQISFFFSIEDFEVSQSLYAFYKGEQSSKLLQNKHFGQGLRSAGLSTQSDYNLH